MSAAEEAWITYSRGQEWGAGKAAFLAGYQTGSDATRERMVQENLNLKADIARAKQGHTPPPPYTGKSFRPQSDADFEYGCPTCGSPDPKLHPAQAGWDDTTTRCKDPWHEV